MIENQDMLDILRKCNQKELIQAIKSCTDQNQINQLFQNLNQLDRTIVGGIESYYQKGYNLFNGKTNNKPQTISIPQNLNQLSLSDFEYYEQISEDKMDRVGFVLVAGGMGERLGSQKIKISLVCEIVSQTTFLKLYLSYLEKFSEKNKKRIRLFLMTSDQTHQQTLEYLSQCKYDHFLDIEIQKQDKVFCFKDLDLNFDFDPKTLNLNLKPHGHGDVHLLIKNSESFKEWKKQNSIDYLFFFQDTNPFSLAILPTLLGVSIEKQYDLNFLAIKIKPGEPYGTLITDTQGKTYNIEYNLYSEVMQSLGVKEDIDEDGYHKYPGNINCYLVKFDTYIKKVDLFDQFKEIANPKIDSQGKLKSSFRLEILMQDLAHLYQNDDIVGITQVDKIFADTSAKNDINTGIEKQKKKLVTQTIVELENDIYLRNFKLLQFIGVKFQNFPLKKQYSNISEIQLVETPRIFIHPSTGVTLKQLRNTFQNCSFNFHRNIYLFIKGNIIFEQCNFNLISLWVENTQEQTLKIQNLQLRTQKEDDLVQFVDSDDKNAKSQVELRNYMVKNLEKMTILKIQQIQIQIFF